MAISDTLKGEAWGAESDLPLVLLKIDHDDIDPPIRVVNNRVSITSNGQTFVPFPFQLILPDSREDSPGRSRLRIDNVSREIGQAIRLIATPASVTIEVVRQDDPDIIEFTLPAMRLINVQYNFLTVEGELEYEDLTREPYPAPTFSPAEYPGLVQ